MKSIYCLIEAPRICYDTHEAHVTPRLLGQQTTPAAQSLATSEVIGIVLSCYDHLREVQVSLSISALEEATQHLKLL